jgi:hypothetical protein
MKLEHAEERDQRFLLPPGRLFGVGDMAITEG